MPPASRPVTARVPKMTPHTTGASITSAPGAIICKEVGRRECGRGVPVSQGGEAGARAACREVCVRCAAGVALCTGHCGMGMLRTSSRDASVEILMQVS
jgi:hypothetical protein